MGDTQSSVSPALVFARPTADQIWLGPSQQTALSQLSRNARARFLVGPGSSGKTTVLNHLASRMAAERVVLQCRGLKDDAHGNPLPKAETLATTGVMPPPLPQTPSTMRRIK
jgi:hypothetical protein